MKLNPREGVVKLHRAQTEVGQHSIRRRQPAGGVQRIDLREIPVLHDQLPAKTRQPVAGHFQRPGIAIEAQKPAAPQTLQNLLRVPPGPQRRVDVIALRPDIEKIESFTDEHGNMDEPGFGIRNSGLARSGFTLRIVLVH